MEHELCGIDRKDTNLLPNYFHYEMSKTCIQLNLELRKEGSDEGSGVKEQK